MKHPRLGIGAAEPAPAPAERGARCPGDTLSLQEDSRAPASLIGQHLPKPRVVSKEGVVVVVVEWCGLSQRART